MNISVRNLAFYLPQYYPTPENDRWWGRGFTEWANVAKANPLYPGHRQPHFPADLGYYDLRVPEVREQQAAIAQQYGVYGFVYYHYWFGNGRRLLDRPLQDILKAGKPGLPFCLCWANQTWKGVWFGEFTGKTLMEQTYPGREDYEQHFDYLLPAFSDDRYIKVDGKPVFNVYIPGDLPSIPEFVDVFNEKAIKAGFPGMFLIASRCPEEWNPLEHGFSGVIGSEMLRIRYWEYQLLQPPNRYLAAVQNRINQLFNAQVFRVSKLPRVVDYTAFSEQMITDRAFDFDYYPCVVPNWDNTPRMGTKGMVFENATPVLFGRQLDKAINKVQHLPDNRRFVFIKSWNEWAEGNYLEPDRQYGYAYLEQVKMRSQKMHSGNLQFADGGTGSGTIPGIVASHT